ncbi:MAG: hypothetical protein KF704_01945 [Crocinitomicaceae bacterium]|nr:hypothetical protein [Crocinitomicaceae bacterium]
METERDLPEISIMGDKWLVDGTTCELINKENPQTRISAFEMEYSREGYRVSYSKSQRTIVPGPPRDVKDILFVHLFHFKTMDPLGVAEKYGLKVEDLKGKTDYDVMADKRHLFRFRDPQYKARIYRNVNNVPVYEIIKDILEEGPRKNAMAEIFGKKGRSKDLKNERVKRKSRGL